MSESDGSTSSIKYARTYRLHMNLGFPLNYSVDRYIGKKAEPGLRTREMLLLPTKETPSPVQE